MQRKTWIALGGTAAAVAALLAWAFAPRPLAVDVARAELAAFEITIDEDAKTRVPERYVVSAPLAGRLARMALREGDAVEVGAVLATLTPVLSPLLDSRTSVTQRARYESADAQVQRALAGVGRAEVGLAQARTELQRSEQLALQGFVSPTQIETQRLALRAARTTLEAAVQERRVAEHEREQARAALAPGGAAALGAAYAVRAPVSGRVLRVLQPSEATVAVGTPILELGDTARLEVVAELLTTDALRLPPAAAVRIVQWGGPGELRGQLKAIEPAASTKVSALGVEEQRVKAVIELTSPRAQWQGLGDGFQVGVRVVAVQQAEALTVPVSAVFPLIEGDAPGAMAVFTVDKGRARRVPVKLGGRNGIQAWVTEGLARGAEVIVYPPAALADGARVKPRRT